MVKRSGIWIYDAAGRPSNRSPAGLKIGEGHPPGTLFFNERTGVAYIRRRDMGVQALTSAAAGPTILVASSQASEALKELAWPYVCDGVDDQVQIQAAVDALPAAGGKIGLTEGTFKQAAGFVIEGKYVVLEGCGSTATVLEKNFNGSSVITIQSSGDVQNHGTTLRDFGISTADGITSGDGITFTPNNTANDLGYIGYLLENIVIGAAVGVGNMLPGICLVINNEEGQGFAYFEANNCWFESTAGATNSVRIKGSPAIASLTFVNTKVTGGLTALFCESVAGFVETLSFFGGEIGNGANWGADLSGVINSGFYNVHFEGNDRCIKLGAVHNLLFSCPRIDGDNAAEAAVEIGAGCTGVTFADARYDGGACPTMFDIVGSAKGVRLICCKPAGSRLWGSSDSTGQTPYEWGNIDSAPTRQRARFAADMLRVAGLSEGDGSRNTSLGSGVAVLFWLPKEGDTTGMTEMSQFMRSITYSESLADFDTPISYEGEGIAIAFNGTDEEADAAAYNQISFGDASVDDPFTIVALLNVTDAAAARTIFAKWNDTSTREYKLTVDASDKLSLHLYDESVDKEPKRVSNAAVSMGAWHLFVATYDGGAGATAANGVVLYEDGQIIASTATNDAGYVAMETGAGVPTIAHNRGNGGAVQEFFSGKAAFIFVIQKELSKDEVWIMKQLVNAHYNLGL